MTEQERQGLKEEIIQELEERFCGIALREDVQGVLSPTRNKWVKNEQGDVKGSALHEAFGDITYWKVWEQVRKLVCLICGVGYVRQISDKELANEIADALCELVCEKRNEVRGNEL